MKTIIPTLALTFMSLSALAKPCLEGTELTLFGRLAGTVSVSEVKDPDWANSGQVIASVAGKRVAGRWYFTETSYWEPESKLYFELKIRETSDVDNEILIFLVDPTSLAVLEGRLLVTTPSDDPGESFDRQSYRLKDLQQVKTGSCPENGSNSFKL